MEDEGREGCGASVAGSIRVAFRLGINCQNQDRVEFELA